MLMLTLIKANGTCSLNSCIHVFHMCCDISYRLRVVSISCDPSFIFSIDSHKLTVIEADGIDTKPLNVDSFGKFE